MINSSTRLLTFIRRAIIMTSIACAGVATLYWLAIASDRYVSEAHLIVQNTELSTSQPTDLSGLLGGLDSGSRTQQLLLRDYLMSTTLLEKLDRELGLRQHFSLETYDLISRMWQRDKAIELFKVYFAKRVTVQFDEYTGLLIIRAEAFEPELSLAIVNAMVREGERFMNELTHVIVRDQVGFLEKDVEKLNKRVTSARSAVIDFQNRNGLVSPQSAIENSTAAIAGLNSRRIQLETEMATMASFLDRTHPDLVRTRRELEAIDQQLVKERATLASNTGQTLNRLTEQQLQLELNAQFLQDLYKTAISALERGRVEAARKVRTMSVVQAPTLPEYPMAPAVLYNVIASLIIIVVLMMVSLLTLSIVKDQLD